jgi:hypothetical protein
MRRLVGPVEPPRAHRLRRAVRRLLRPSGSRTDRLLTGVGVLAVLAIAVGAPALLTLSLAQSKEPTRPPIRRSWPGALERQVFQVVPAEASIESLGADRVLSLFDELMQGEPAWGQGAYVYFFGRHIEPYVALHESLVATGQADSQRARDCIERALVNCEKLTGRGGYDARAYLADYDKKRDGYLEWVVTPDYYYTAWRNKRFRAAIANGDAASRAAWIVARFCAGVWSDPALQAEYGPRVRAVAAFIARHVVRNPHYRGAFDPEHNGTHVWSGQIAPRNALTLLDLAQVLDSDTLERRGLILARRIRTAAARFARQMPGGEVLLTSLDCVKANTTTQAWAGLETWGRRMTDGKGHTFCAPSDTSHLNAYIALLTDCRRRAIVFPDWYVRQALVTMRGMWVSSDQPMEAYDRAGNLYRVSEQFTDYPGRRLVTILPKPHKVKSTNVPGMLGRNICPGWVGLVTMALDDPAYAQDPLVQNLAGILRTMPLRGVSAYSIPAFLGYGYRFVAAGSATPSPAAPYGR